MSSSPPRIRQSGAGPPNAPSRSRPQAEVLAEVLGSAHPHPASASYASASHMSSGRLHAPAGRVQAADFQPPPLSPVIRPGSPPSPSLRNQGSQASLSSLDSNDRFGSRDDEMYEEQHINELNASTISVVAQMFDPNLYLHAQEAWEQWEDERRADGDVDEQSAPGTEDGYPAGSAISRRTEEMSERAGLMNSSIAARKVYGTMPEGSVATSGSRFGGHQIAASSLRIPAVTRQHDEPTMQDAMKTADIGGTPGSNLGILLLAVAQLSYSLMNGFVSLLDSLEGEKAPGRGPDHPPISAFEIVFVECFIIWLGAIATMVAFKTPHILLGPPKARLTLVLRGTFGFLSTLFLYLSLQNLSLSDATGIIFLGPLVTGATAAVYLGEPFPLRERLAGIGSLAGVLLIARPTAIFGGEMNSDVPSAPGDTPPIGGDDGPPAGSGDRLFGVLIALAGVLCQAGAWVFLRKLGRSCSTYHSIAYFALCSWTLSLAGMLIMRQPFVVPSTIQAAVVLFSIGLFSLLAQVFQTLGLQRETAGRAAMVSYIQIVFSTAFQCIVLGTPLEVLSILGSLLVLANGAWVAASKRPGDIHAGVH